MTLAHELHQQLQHARTAGGPAHLSVPTADGRLECDLVAVDQIGCSFTRLEGFSNRLAGKSLDELKAIGQQLARQVNYLLEPIQILELDPQTCAVQLRSVPPRRQGKDRTYYEVLVRAGGSIELRRFEKCVGQPRQPVTAQVTLEVFDRLAQDIVDAA